MSDRTHIHTIRTAHASIMVERARASHVRALCAGHTTLQFDARLPRLVWYYHSRALKNIQKPQRCLVCHSCEPWWTNAWTFHATFSSIWYLVVHAIRVCVSCVFAHGSTVSGDNVIWSIWPMAGLQIIQLVMLTIFSSGTVDVATQHHHHHHYQCRQIHERNRLDEQMGAYTHRCRLRE